MWPRGQASKAHFGTNICGGAKQKHLWHLNLWVTQGQRGCYVPLMDPRLYEPHKRFLGNRLRGVNLGSKVFYHVKNRAGSIEKGHLAKFDLSGTFCGTAYADPKSRLCPLMGPISGA